METGAASRVDKKMETGAASRVDKKMETGAAGKIHKEMAELLEDMRKDLKEMKDLHKTFDDTCTHDFGDVWPGEPSAEVSKEEVRQKRVERFAC